MQQCFTYFDISLINARQDAQWRTSKYQRSTSRWLSNVDLVRIIYKLLHNFSKNVMSTNMLITFHIFHLKAIHSHTKSYVGVTTCATTRPRDELWVVEGSPYMDPPSPHHYSQLATWTSCGTNCATSCSTSITLIPTGFQRPRQCAHYTMVKFRTANRGFQFWYICQGLLLISMPMQMRFIKMNFNR